MTNLKNVNIMSDAKYEAATKNSDELYFTPADSYVDSRITSKSVGFPDYSKVTQITTSLGTYTATKNCWITFNVKNDNHSHASITIGSYNVYIGRQSADDSNGRWFGLPVKKGQVINWSYSGKVYIYWMPFVF